MQNPADDGLLMLERYAEVLAHAVYFGAAFRSETLARLGVDESAWAAADAKWTAVLVAEALKDERPMTGAFAAVYAPILRRLKNEKSEIVSIGALPTNVQPSERTATEPPSPTQLDESLPAELPPLVNAPEMRWARWAGAQDVGGETAGINVEALRRSLLPFVKGSPSPGFSASPVQAAQVPSAVRAASPPEDDGHGTVILENVVVGPALPFVQPPIAGPPRKRLARFDSQTGQPLREPVWVDMPDPRKRE